MRSVFINFLFISVVCCIISSCASKRVPTEIHYIKPPLWVREAGNNDGFSSVGITSKNLSIKEANVLAVNNAIDNLKINIFVKIENFFLEEMNVLDENVIRNKGVAVMFNKILNETITEQFLKAFSRQDELWKSPDSDMLYVKVVIDKKQIAAKLVDAFEKEQQKYMYDNELVFLINKIKNDMLYYNFKCSKKTEKNIKDFQKKVKQSKNNDSSGMNTNIYVLSSTDDKNTIKVEDDASNEFSSYNDEIDDVVNNIINKKTEDKKRSKFLENKDK